VQAPEQGPGLESAGELDEDEEPVPGRLAILQHVSSNSHAETGPLPKASRPSRQYCV